MGIKYHHLPREPWPANIPKKLSKNEKGWHPHNFILGMMCEYGLVGGVIILVPLGIFILCAMRAVFSVHTDISHIQSTAIAPAILFTTARLFTGSLAEIWPLVFVLFACMPLSAEQSRRFMRGSLQEADPVSPTEPPTPQSVQVDEPTNPSYDHILKLTAWTYRREHRECAAGFHGFATRSNPVTKITSRTLGTALSLTRHAMSCLCTRMWE